MSRFLTHIAYTGADSLPTLFFSNNQTLAPLGKDITLSFDLSTRYCIGWHDLASGDNHPCPESATTDKKYDTCPACQKRTGFKPAFYHANSISAKQEARNAEPHRLYLAYMGNNYIKVGISWDKRGMKRLLDQGARAGLVLETFPTALIARQYEAKIAALDDIHETTSTRTKLSLLSHQIDKPIATEQLLATKERIEKAIDTTFSGKDVLFLDNHYTTSSLPSGQITTLSGTCISGTVTGLIGDILLTHYDGRTLALPLKQFTGYDVDTSDTITPLDLEPEQMQLF